MLADLRNNMVNRHRIFANFVKWGHATATGHGVVRERRAGRWKPAAGRRRRTVAGPVSRQMAALEASLGVQLLNRTSRT